MGRAVDTLKCGGNGDGDGFDLLLAKLEDQTSAL
jgi:hypothetical protein